MGALWVAGRTHAGTPRGRPRPGGKPAARPRKAAAAWAWLETAALSAGLGVVCWARVYLGYHSPAQVLAGAAAGLAWMTGWQALAAGPAAAAIHALLTSSLAVYLGI